MLEDKNAIVYGAGGSIGGAVARAFAREGATVHLAGRTLARLDAVAEQIRSAGGAADTAQVDALDEAAVDAHADDVAARAGSLDISFSLTSFGDVQGTPLVEMPLDDYERPVRTVVRTTFLTSLGLRTGAARDPRGHSADRRDTRIDSGVNRGNGRDHRRDRREDDARTGSDP